MTVRVLKIYRYSGILRNLMTTKSDVMDVTENVCCKHDSSTGSQKEISVIFYLLIYFMGITTT